MCKTAPDLTYAEYSDTWLVRSAANKDWVGSGSGFDAAKPPDDARLEEHGVSTILIPKLKPLCRLHVSHLALYYVRVIEKSISSAAGKLRAELISNLAKQLVVKLRLAGLFVTLPT
jgi:hypothetical protein